MKNDLFLLTLLYAVACSAFIGAINARGPVRVALSYFLAILTLCAAIFNTSQYIASGSLSVHGDDNAVVLPPPPSFPAPGANTAAPAPTPPPAPATAATVMAAPVNAAPSDTAGLGSSKNDVATAEAKNALKTVLESARRVSGSLAALNLGNVADISDEEYESMQNKTVSYLAEARRTKEKLAPLATKPPEGVKAAADNLSKGIEALVTAAYNAERFFKSENETEEKSHLAAFRSGSQTAKSLFKKAGSELGAADASE